MKGLIIKDILSLRKNIKMMGAMLLFFAVFAFIGNDVTFVSGMATLLMTMLTVTTLAYDEASKWDRYALSLPITRKQLVLSKYLLTLLLALGGAVISLIILLTASLTGNGISVIEALATVYGLFWVSLVFTGILLPLTYKFGVEKSRLFVFAIFGLPTLGVYFLHNAGVQMPDAAALTVLAWLSPFILAAVFTVSCLISQRIYMGKDL